MQSLYLRLGWFSYLLLVNCIFDYPCHEFETTPYIFPRNQIKMSGQRYKSAILEMFLLTKQAGLDSKNLFIKFMEDLKPRQNILFSIQNYFSRSLLPKIREEIQSISLGLTQQNVILEGSKTIRIQTQQVLPQNVKNEMKGKERMRYANEPPYQKYSWYWFLVNSANSVNAYY